MGRRKRWTDEQVKQKIANVIELRKKGVSITQATKENQINPSQFYKWTKKEDKVLTLKKKAPKSPTITQPAQEEMATILVIKAKRSDVSKVAASLLEI